MSTVKRRHVAATMTGVAAVVLMRNIRALTDAKSGSRITRPVTFKTHTSLSYRTRRSGPFPLLVPFLLISSLFLFFYHLSFLSDVLTNQFCNGTKFSRDLSRNKLLPKDVSLPTSALAHENEFLSCRRVSKRVQ